MEPGSMAKKTGPSAIFSRRTPKSGDSDDRKPVLPRGNGAARALWWAGALAIAFGSGTAGLATGALAGFLLNAPPIPAMENYDPPQTTVLADRSGEPFARYFLEQRSVVPIREIPARLTEAFVAIEDTNFAHHIGIDPKSVARAAVANTRSRRASQGASTITQQLARNLPLGIGREKTLQRKVREALTALQMERSYTKDQILEVYLNQIYLGSGTYGIDEAARKYFGRKLDDLSPSEMAMLAGLPQRPESWSPLNNPQGALERRNMVLDRLFALEWIGDREYLDALDSELVTRSGGTGASTQEWAGWFADAARAELASLAEIDAQTLRADGLRIRTTMDPELQRIAVRVLAEGLEAEQETWLSLRQERFAEARESEEWWRRPAPGQTRMATVVHVFPESLVVELAGGWRADLKIPAGTAELLSPETGIVPGAGVDVAVSEVEDAGRRLWRGRLLPDTRLQGAIVCLDRESGEVLALSGGHTWGDRDANGWFNRSISARRQAGSTLKPFFFAHALENGFHPDSLLLDEPVRYGEYVPRNYDHRFHGVVTMQKALEESYNVCTLRMIQGIGLKSAVRRVGDFDLAAGAPHWDLPGYLPVVLGTSGVTPLELAAAYQTVANAGTGTRPTAVRSVLSGNDRRVNLPPRRSNRLLDDRVAAELTQMLLGVMTHGTGDHIRETLPAELRDCVAGKSGTTSDNRDAWFAGFTPNIVAVVWIGFDTPLPLGPGRSGGRSAGPVWGRFVAEASALPEYAPTGPLALPDGWQFALYSKDAKVFVDPEGKTAGGPYTWRVVGEKPFISREEPIATAWGPGFARQ